MLEQVKNKSKSEKMQWAIDVRNRANELYWKKVVINDQLK